MQRPHEIDDEESVEFRVPLDLQTVAWLMEICDGAHMPPAAVIAAMIKDIRKDDETEHSVEMGRVPAGVQLN